MYGRLYFLAGKLRCRRLGMMKRVTVTLGVIEMTKGLDDLALAIDAASDAGDEELLRKYGSECERRLPSAKGMDRVLLNYYRANTYSAIIEAKRNDENYTWSWEQPDGVQDVLALRRAIIEPAFDTCHSIRICQIRTNLANRLSTLGRPIAANEQWLKVLKIEPGFAKALAARDKGFVFLQKIFTIVDTHFLCWRLHDLYTMQRWMKNRSGKVATATPTHLA